MGQGLSAEPPTPRSHEQLAKELANRFAEKCFSSLELYSLKDNFKCLADREQNVRYLREDTVARFLEIPDILHASPVVFHMLTYLGAFPFLADAPAVLGLEQVVIVVTLLTDRYRRVLAHGAADQRTLLFRSLAVHDRLLFADGTHKIKTTVAVDGEAFTGTETVAELKKAAVETTATSTTAVGFAVDAAVDDDDDGGAGDSEDEEFDDNLAMAALEVLDFANPLPKAGTAHRRKAGTAQQLHGACIPADNFRKLLLLMLLLAPLGPQSRLSQHADRVTGKALESLRATAECLLSTFLDVETTPGIPFLPYSEILPVCFPYLFHGFHSLFEHFLFSHNLDFSKMKSGRQKDGKGQEEDSGGEGQQRTVGDVAARRKSSSSTQKSPTPQHPTSCTPPPLFLHESADTILNTVRLAQISFFLPGSSLFHRLRLMYAGNEDGFSLGSFETKVFNWRAPTILLVQGTRVGDVPRSGQEAAFAASLPPRRFTIGSKRTARPATRNENGSDDDDNDDADTLIFGVYISQPWKLTHRECFGDSDCVLFQLAPVHDVFGASSLNRNYVSFVRPTAANHHAGGLAFGCPPPPSGAAIQTQKQHSQNPHDSPSQLHGIPPCLSRHQSSSSGFSGTSGGSSGSFPMVPLGPLSLAIDASFEYGVMTHDREQGGGAYRSSVARPFNFQERFSIEALEIWGCGGDAEAKVQAERWAFEKREAEARRRINLGTGDMEADRQLLEMAGLIGQNRSGGSMG